MSVRIAPLIAMTAAGAVAAATGPAAAAGRSCAPPRAHVIRSDPQAQVYVGGGTMFACARRSGRRLRLGTTTTCIAHDLAQRVALRGLIVAVASERCGIDTGSTEIVVWQLGRRLPLASGPAGSALRPESYTTVTSLLLSRRGSPAWIATTHSLGGGGERIEVRSLVRGRDTLLDAAPGIKTRSLRLRGTTLTWRDGATERTASLL